MVELKKRLCTSKKFKKGQKAKECGTELLILESTDGDHDTFICPDCDALELMPKSMRERIKEQWEV